MGPGPAKGRRDDVNMSAPRRSKELQMRSFGSPFRFSFDEKGSTRRACALLSFLLRFPTTFWTARPSIRSRRRSRNTVFPFGHLLQKSSLKVTNLRAFGSLVVQISRFWLPRSSCWFGLVVRVMEIIKTQPEITSSQRAKSI